MLLKALELFPYFFFVGCIVMWVACQYSLALCCGAAIICSVAINFALKYIAIQTLPCHLVARPCQRRVCSIWGMPSGHAQTMGLVASYLTCLAIHNRKVSWIPWIIILWILTVAVCWQRVHTTQHTELQVAAGFVVGCVLGLVIFTLTIRNGVNVNNGQFEPMFVPLALIGRIS